MGAFVAAIVVATASFFGWRKSNQTGLTRIRRALLAVGSGAAGGASSGVVIGLILGLFLGLNPGSPDNEGFMAVAFGLLGLIIGGLGALVVLQRRSP